MLNNFDVIHSYTTQEAVADGYLVDLTLCFPAEVYECGIQIPLYCTRSVYEKYIKLTKKAKEACNDEKGRAWDVLFMSRSALKAAFKTGNSYLFKFYCVVTRIRPTLCTCKVIFDGASFTILEVDED